MNFRAYIVDDEPLAVRRLERLLAATGRFEIAGSTSDPDAAVEFLSRERVDVLFLDIQMPGRNGFELLAALPEQPAVIFTTAYDQYALRAFEVNSIDYLLKPIEPYRLDRAIAKLDRLRGSRPEWLERPDVRAVLAELAASLRTSDQRPPDRIASRIGDRVQFIELDRVTHFVAQDKLTYAIAGARKYSVESSIVELESKLDSRRFVRIHRSTLVNVEWVAEVDARVAGRVTVRLKDEAHTALAVARDRVRFLRERLGF
ncbi:MAG TPA: LytTR family DNA-binding domain-containing protein [Bryobacteraceae bacterium]|nr:LytTR family DNA-binding domain-containing protein [Bryobacteraceae bacterium]